MIDNTERNEKIIALRLKGWSNGKIAAEVGCTTGTVAGVCHRNGLNAKHVRSTIKAHETPQAPSWAGSKSFKRDGCRFISGDPLTADWQYCNHPVDGAGSSWCAEHRARCHMKRPMGEAA